MPKSYNPRSTKKDIYKKDPGATISSTHKALPDYERYIELKEISIKKSPNLSNMIGIPVGLKNIIIFVEHDCSPEEIEYRKQRYIENLNRKN
jgi:hypothetical protein